MLQKFLDGKKKYSAFLITVLAALVPLFVPQPEAQNQVMELVPSIAVILSGIVYMVTQGKIDDDKVKVQAVNGQTATATASLPGALAPAPQAQPTATVLAPAPVEPEIEFDVKTFHQTVLDTVKSIYTEVSPATIFYRARDLGKTTVCQSLKQARQYWDYLVGLGYDADAWFKEMDAKTKGQCGRSVNYAIWQQDFSNTLNQQGDLYQLLNSGIDWQTKLTPTNCTLINVGAQAKEMLHPQWIGTGKI